MNLGETLLDEMLLGESVLGEGELGESELGEMLPREYEIITRVQEHFFIRNLLIISKKQHHP